MEVKHNNEQSYTDVIAEKFAPFNSRSFSNDLVTIANQLGLKNKEITALEELKHPTAWVRLHWEEKDNG